jgi:peroxiredoxin Q/BCP
MLQPGDEAPDFAVGGDTLHGLLARGPVVVFFFPKAFTPGCTKEACAFRQRFEELQKGGGTVIGVST